MSSQAVNAGFTLIELLVVVTLVALLQSLAVPAFVDLVRSIRLTTTVNALLSSLILARSEAIKRNTRAVVCKSVNGDACVGTGGWNQGWLVFQDANNNAVLDAGEVVVLRQSALPQSIRLTGNAPLANYVSFTPMGSTQYTSGAFQAGTLTVCPQSADRVEARKIVISSAGRPRVAHAMVDSCP